MRTLPNVLALLVLLSCSGANAQSNERSKQASALSSKGVGTRALGEFPKDMRDHMQAWYQDCRRGWDAKTHMSKKDYERTCRRMAHERIKYLHDDTKSRSRSK
jgi:hypothetical protein